MSGSRRFEAEVPAALAGQRLDRALALLVDVPRRVAADLVAAGAVQVDGRPALVRSRPLAGGERLAVDLPDRADVGPRPDPAVAFTVVAEDDQLVVVDKPAGLVVHAGAGHAHGTLVEGLLARYPELAALPAAGAGDADRPGIVHRLDRGTSGLLVVARTPEAVRSLTAQLAEHRAERVYLALVLGTVADEAGVVDAPVGRSQRRPTRMVVTNSGRPARTAYRVLERFTRPQAATLVEVTLETGRTHQVRVHLAAIGHPVLGDDQDGPAWARPAELAGDLAPGRLFLHAARLSLDHPGGGRRTWTSPLPPDLQAVLDRLG